MQAWLRLLLSACLGLVLASPALAQDKPPANSGYSIGMRLTVCSDPAAAPSPASLVPAHTLAYLELHQPDRLAEEVRELLKGSLLQDPGRIVARARRSHEDHIEQAMLSTLFSPEILAELGDCKGGVVALTGVADDGTPQVVGILQTGKGRLASLALRVYLASGDGVKSVGQVEGVTIYRVGETTSRACCAVSSAAVGATTGRTAPVVSYYHSPANGGARLYLAQLPEAIVAGSSRAVVADTVRRLKGKSKSPSLADNKTFQEAASLRTGPGLFAYADAPRLYRLLKTPIRKQAAADKGMARQWKLLQAMLNPTAVRFVAGSCSLQKGECRSCLEVRTQEGQSIPALDWLAEQKLSDDLLRTVPRDAFFVVALPVSEKLRSLDFCESIDRLHGSLSLGFGLPDSAARQVPADDKSEASESTESSPAPLSAREIEKRMEMHVGKDVLARIHTLAVAGGLKRAADPKAIDCIPVVLIEAASAEDARELEKLWPRLHSLGGNVSQPRSVKVRDETVLCLAAKTDKEAKDDKALSPMPSYYGRSGKVLVLGWQAGRVAAALRAPKEERPLLSLPRAQATAQKEAAGLFVLFSGRQLLRQTCSLVEEEDTSMRAVVRQLHHMSRAMKKVPPTVFLVKHEGNRYCCEMRQSGLKTAAVPVLNALVRLLASMDGTSNRCVAPPPVNTDVVLPSAPPSVPDAAPAPPASPGEIHQETSKALPSEERSEAPVVEPPVPEPPPAKKGGKSGAKIGTRTEMRLP
jgi:hypothetical protein